MQTKGLEALKDVGEDVISNIIDELYNKHNGITRQDIKRVVMSQFKLLKQELNNEGIREVKMIHLGSFVPTKRHLENTNRKNTNNGSK